MLIYGTYLTVVGFLAFVLWQALFGSRDAVENHGKEQTTQSDQQNPGKQMAGSSVAPKPHNPAEEAIADYTRWLAIFTSLLVLATVALFVSGERNVEVASRSADAAKVSAQAAKESADVAREALIAANRAWLDMEVQLVGDLVHETDAARVTIKYTLKNHGTAVATNVIFEPRLVLHNWGEIEGTPPGEIKIIQQPTHVPTELFNFCQQQTTPVHENFVKTNWVGGATIFPTKEDSSQWRPHIQLTEMATAAAQGNRGTFMVYLLVCASYRFPADKSAHYTGRAYMLLRRDGELFRPGENITAANLRLEPAWFGTGIAN